ncbi:MAG: MarR family EPS-associated transcriptional regulator [Deltaproteobacteria bacterium]|nr:MarR family EPS-associated transcriptional regulator [Deltaproteobacteria bacterium]
MTELEFKILREISKNGNVSQRDLSRKMGISLGSVNYVIRKLVEKGFVKVNRFKNSRNKISYIYVLTPQGIKELIRQTKLFLKKSYQEYLLLKAEMEEVKKKKRELNANSSLDALAER